MTALISFYHNVGYMTVIIVITDTVTIDIQYHKVKLNMKWKITEKTYIIDDPLK